MWALHGRIERPYEGVYLHLELFRKGWWQIGLHIVTTFLG